MTTPIRVVPYDPANYALYHQIRAGDGGEQQSGIALARADLAATALTPLDGGGADRRAPVRIGAATHRAQVTVRCRPAGDPAQRGAVDPADDPGAVPEHQQGGQSAAAQTLSRTTISNPSGSPTAARDQPSAGEGGSAISRFRAMRRIPSSPAFPRAAMRCSSRVRMRLQYQISTEWRDPHQRADRPAAQRGELHRHAQQRTRAGKRMRRRHAALDRARGHGQCRARPRDADDTLSDRQSAREAVAGGGAIDRRQREARRETPGVLRVARRLRQSQLAHVGASATHDAARRRHERVSCRHGRTRRCAQRHDVHRLGFRSHPGVELTMARITAGARIIS